MRRRTFIRVSGCEEEYRQRFQKDHNIAEAHVVSAVTLSSQQKAALKAKLEEVWKKEIILVTKTDPNLMGGLKVEIEGRSWTEASAADWRDCIS